MFPYDEIIAQFAKCIQKDNSIIITEIPYGTFREDIVDKIIMLVKEGKLKEVLSVKDLTDLKGLKIKVECRKNTNLDLVIENDAAMELANRCRRTPRIANRLLKRVSDFALVKGDGTITLDITKFALDSLKVDKLGLDEVDYEFLKTIIYKFNGGPVGIEAIAASIGEEVTTLEDVCEPYLLQIGYLKRTPRGRIVTEKAYKHLNIDRVNNE